MIYWLRNWDLYMLLDAFDYCLLLNGFFILMEIVILVRDFHYYKNTKSCINISLFFVFLMTILNVAFYHEFKTNDYIILEVLQVAFNVAILGIILSIWLVTIEIPKALEDDEIDEDDTDDDIIEDMIDEN